MEEERMEVFLELFREEPPVYIQRLEQEAREHEVPVIRRGTRDVLRYLLRTKKPERILEVGTAVGYSALFMMENMPENAEITTVEKVERRLADARPNYTRYDKEGRICLIEGDAAKVLHDLSEQGKQYDFIFMDAAKGQYLNFLPDVMKLAVTRRDRTIHERMREYLEVLTHHRELETICLPVGDGITISTKKEVAQYEKA